MRAALSIARVALPDAPSAIYFFMFAKLNFSGFRAANNFLLSNQLFFHHNKFD